MYEVFKVMKNKDLKPRLFHPARLSFKVKGEIKTFPDQKLKKKGLGVLKKCITTKTVLQEILKGLL